MVTIASMSKPALPIARQIELLVERGLPVPLPTDESWETRKSEYHAVVRLLVDNNYYRLSGYWRYFQVRPGQGDNRFTAAASVAQIESVYRFDQDLRTLLIDGLSTLEVTFRSRLAYYLADQLAPDCYLDPASYTPGLGSAGRPLRDELIADIQKELSRSKERFVQHHQARGDAVPVWAVVETLSFGTVSKMYRLLAAASVRTAVSKSFSMPNPQFTASLMKSMVVLRNHCAHHGRLWNRVPEVPPPVLNKFKNADPQLFQTATPWAWFVMLSELVDVIRHNTVFSTQLSAHLDSRPDLRDGYQYPRHT